MQTPQERAKELAVAHWYGYVEDTVSVHMPDRNRTYTRDEVLAIAKHHYISASCHGYKHAISDERAGIFRPRIGELSAVEVEAIGGEVGLCGMCRSDHCEDSYPTETSCSSYVPAIESLAPLDLSLPSITLPGTEHDVWAKYHEELEECRRERPYSMGFLVERWDVLQALQTHKERGGHSPETYATVARDLEDMHAGGMPVMEAKRQMILKNATRMRPTVGGECTGYYAPEVCARILATSGASFTP